MDEKKNIKPIVKGKELRKSLSQSFTDEAKSVATSIFKEIILPTLKNVVSESISSGIERMLFGEVNPPPYYNRPRTGYTSYSTPRPTTIGKMNTYYNNAISTAYVNVKKHKDIVLSSRDEANAVLKSMSDLIIDYGAVSVADYYDLCGIQNNYTDYNVGWTNLSGTNITRARGGGYILLLPPAEPI